MWEWGRVSPGLWGTLAQEEGSPKEDEKTEDSSLSVMMPESAWQLVPLPPPPWGPSHTLGLSSELYIYLPAGPEPLLRAPPSTPCVVRALAQTPCLVRGDEDKPASEPQEDLYSRRTGAVGAGRGTKHCRAATSTCPKPDPPGAGAKQEARQGRREEQVGGFVQLYGRALCEEVGELGSSPLSHLLPERLRKKLLASLSFSLPLQAEIPLSLPQQDEA